MDKVRVGLSMATRWSDPSMVLIGVVVFGTTSLAGLTVMIALWLGLKGLAVIPITLICLYKFVYLNTGEANVTKYVKFNDQGLEKSWGSKRIPMSILYEAFIKGDVEFHGDVLETLGHRDEFVCYRPTWSVIFFLIKQLIPIGDLSSSFHDQATTKREIADHYDRGNDFFRGFLGPMMIYTSGVFHGLHQTLEQAQTNKLALLCDKLQLKPKERFLDIGCGWGTLVRFAASQYKADASGVTLSAEGAKWCEQQNREEGVKTNILEMDYRDIPLDKKFHKITAIEMAEHVGLRNFQLFLNRISTLLDDDGMFLMQVAGLRQGASWQDVAWGLFMSKYIFPGADASTPLNWYIHQCELAGFEIRSVETIGRHYSHTLHRWYNNFLDNKTKLAEKYPVTLLRLWEIFLAWSVIAAGQGSATCYQILMHKNTNTFPRDIFCDPKVSGTGVGLTKTQ